MKISDEPEESLKEFPAKIISIDSYGHKIICIVEYYFLQHRFNFACNQKLCIKRLHIKFNTRQVPRFS